MKYSEGSIGRVFVMRLEDGDVIPDCLEKFATEMKLAGGLCALLGGAGSGKLVVGPEDGDATPIIPLAHALAGVHEAVAVGTIFPNEAGALKLHMHMAAGRDGKSRTGCVRLGVDVWKIMEVVIIEIQDTGMLRKVDPDLGFELLTNT